MTPGIGIIASAVLVLAAASLLAALFVAALYPMTRKWMRGLPPAAHAGLLLALACTPAIIGLALLILTLAPSFTHLLGLEADHCQVHGHHAHFCLVHTPLSTGTDLERLVLFASGIAILLLGTGVSFRLRRVRRVVRALRTLQVRDSAHRPYSVVDSGIAFALTAGLVRPAIYLSTGLLKEISPAELAVVVHHEQTHCRRRDALRLFVADLLSRLHLPPLRRRLLADLHLASEQACDEQAARITEDRLCIAETILKVVRLSAGTRPASDTLLPTVTGSDIQARIDALLHPAPTPSGSPCLSVFLGAGLLGTFGYIYSDGLHHAVESALHLLSD
ncbi:MAG: M56 family metallopeptidase [Pseudomonadota bacterium]|nr:M56 family metallopeptidase [Pseudomonadota bacterium]